MAATQRLSPLQVDEFVFPPAVKAPGSDKSFFLGGAGERGRSDLTGVYVRYTAIGVYLEESAISVLAGKWKGKTADELAGSVEFYKEITSGPFEKFIQVTMCQPLTGEQYTVNFCNMFVARQKELGVHTEEEAKAVEMYLKVFEDKKFQPGETMLFTLSPDGKFTIALSKHDVIPADGVAVIQNKSLPEAIFYSIIGENGVCPGAKQTLAARLSDLLSDDVKIKVDEKIEVVKEVEA